MTWGTLGMVPLHAVATALAQLAREQPVCSFSCYEVNLRGCLLQDLLVSFSRPPGSREEESFICRLGEIQVRKCGVGLVFIIYCWMEWWVLQVHKKGTRDYCM